MWRTCYAGMASSITMMERTNWALCHVFGYRLVDASVCPQPTACLWTMTIFTIWITMAQNICRSATMATTRTYQQIPANDPSMCGQALVYMQRLPSGNRELIVQDVRTLSSDLSMISRSTVSMLRRYVYGWYGRNDRKFICRSRWTVR